jgi:hypothetical protein
MRVNMLPVKNRNHEADGIVDRICLSINSFIKFSSMEKQIQISMENDEKNANWGLLSISNQRVNWELGI